jgi:hypothetical protein
MEPLSSAAELGAEPAKRESEEGEEEGEQVAWHGGTPGARLGAGRNGRNGRALKEKGTEGPLPPAPFPRAGEGGNRQPGPSFRRRGT